MTSERTPRDIPKASTAARILTYETHRSLIDFYSSDALKVTTDKGIYDPAKQRAKFVGNSLNETPAFAEYLLSRFLWHHANSTIKLDNWRDFQFISGLLQFETASHPWMTREQEIAFLRVTRTIYSAKGNAGFTKTYGVNSIGTWMLDEELIRYVLNRPDISELVCNVLRDRGVLDAKEMIALVESTNHESLMGGVL